MSQFPIPENYTPGPWLRCDTLIYALTDCTTPGGTHWRNRARVRVNRFDAMVQSSGYDGAPLEERSANAALIALAPAMAAEIRRLERENAALRKIIDGCDWYWPADDTTEDCAFDPFETFNGDTGEVYGVSRGGIVETRFYAVLPPAEGSDDDFLVDEATQEAAQAAVDTEMARRSPAEPLEGGAP